MREKSVSLKLLVAVLALGTMTIGAGNLQPKGKGTVKVTVVDGAKAPLVGIKIQLYRSPRTAAGGNGADGVAPNSAFGNGNAMGMTFQQGTPVAAKETDKNGLVEFTDISAGRYRVAGGSQSLGRGSAAFSIEGGKTENVTLEIKK